MLLPQTRLLGIVMLCLCGVTFVANAQNEAPVHPVDGQYIKEWLVLGPFFPNDLDKDFLASVGGEAKVDPKKGDTVITANGQTLMWKRYTSQRDVVNLVAAVGYHEYATAYALCTLQSQETNYTKIGIRNDDGIAIWINGKQVYSYPTYRDLSSVDLRDLDGFDAELKAGANRCLVKVHQLTRGWGFAMRVLPQSRAVISGVITHEQGYPLAGTTVRLQQKDGTTALRQTDTSGTYRFAVYPVVNGGVDLLATSGDLGDQRLGIPLRAGDRKKIDLTLKRAISISGQLLMLDDTTLHVACVVQAVTTLDGSADGGGPEPTVIATTLTDENGRFKLVNLLPGAYGVRCYTSNGYVYYQNGKMLYIEHGKGLLNIDFRFAPFKKGVWRHYIASDGLAYNAVNCILADPSGMMLFGTDRGGVSQFDGSRFAPLTANNGSSLPVEVWSLYRDLGGIIWIGTPRIGIFRYDGKEFRNFRVEDGLLTNSVFFIHGAPDGAMWFTGYPGSGVSRYDGESFFTFPATTSRQPQMPIYHDTNGRMWFTTGEGFCRYDGQQFVNFELKDGFENLYKDGVDFVPNGRRQFYRDSAGSIWTRWQPPGQPNSSVFRYDEKGLTGFTSKDGLPSKELFAITGEPNGIIWFGMWRNTDGSGLSRYDGVGFINFTIDDGMLSPAVKDLYVDADGALWVATGSQANSSRRGGVSRYDDKTFVNFTAKDGLLSDRVQTISHDADGALWIGTVGGGVARYDGTYLW